MGQFSMKIWGDTGSVLNENQQVQDIKEYEAFTQAHFFDESNISRFKTAVVMDRVKASLDVL